MFRWLESITQIHYLRFLRRRLWVMAVSLAVKSIFSVYTLQIFWFSNDLRAEFWSLTLKLILRTLNINFLVSTCLTANWRRCHLTIEQHLWQTKLCVSLAQQIYHLLNHFALLITLRWVFQLNFISCMIAQDEYVAKDAVQCVLFVGQWMIERRTVFRSISIRHFEFVSFHKRRLSALHEELDALWNSNEYNPPDVIAAIVDISSNCHLCLPKRE